MLHLLIVVESKELYWSKISSSRVNQYVNNHTSTLVFDEYVVIVWSSWMKDMTDHISIYNIKTNVWETFLIVGKHPGQQEGHSACLYKNNEIIIFGGLESYKEMACGISELVISKEGSSKEKRCT